MVQSNSNESEGGPKHVSNLSSRRIPVDHGVDCRDLANKCLCCRVRSSTKQSPHNDCKQTHAHGTKGYKGIQCPVLQEAANWLQPPRNQVVGAMPTYDTIIWYRFVKQKLFSSSWAPSDSHSQKELRPHRSPSCVWEVTLVMPNLILWYNIHLHAHPNIDDVAWQA